MTTSNRLSKFELACGLLAAAVPLLFYTITLPPTITFEDSGQLITAAARLGVSHPSGYPLAALVGHLFTLIPVGRMAARVNFASAVAAAACCAVLFFLLRRLFLDLRAEARGAAAAAAATAAIAFGLSRSFWSQAVVAEAYAINALALATVLFAALNFIRTRRARWGYLGAFVAGLALGAHTSSVIVTLPVAGYVIWRFRKLPGYRGFFLAVALVALGATVYLYLPLRAAQGPAINWGDPRTLPAMYAHVTRRMYGGPETARLQFLPYHLYELGKFLWAEFAAPGLTAAAVGVVLGVVRRAKPWSFLALLLLPTGPVATFALVLLLQAHQLPGIQVWYLPFFLLTSCFLGLTLFSLAASRRRWLRGLGYVALAAAVVAPPLTNFYWDDYRDYYYAEDYGANFLRTISYGGLNIMFERGSLGTFETAYLKKVEWYRPDHVFVDATGSVYKEYELFAKGRLDEGDPMAARRWEQAFERDLLSSATRRDIYYTIFREDVRAFGLTLEPAGMLYQVHLPPRERRPIAPVWGRYAMRGVAEAEADPEAPRMHLEEWIRVALVKYKTMLARDYFLAGDEEKAFATLEAAAPLAYGMTEPLLELGNVYALNGHYAEALRYFDGALEAYPRRGAGVPAVRYHYAQVWANKAVAHLHLGDVDGAEAAYRASLEAYPDQPDIRLISRRENLVRAAEAFAAESEAERLPSP
ncbi:MAG: DUF2723 domain-containing protein [Candidatus Coatesbacteria bacterium]|nr:MAG: DUF2723 domain-containing protein [Candidatus Coatesbacteria bacterium]